MNLDLDSFHGPGERERRVLAVAIRCREREHNKDGQSVGGPQSVPREDASTQVVN
jgi:hypothetical protein